MWFIFSGIWFCGIYFIKLVWLGRVWKWGKVPNVWTFGWRRLGCQARITNLTYFLHGGFTPIDKCSPNLLAFQLGGSEIAKSFGHCAITTFLALHNFTHQRWSSYAHGAQRNSTWWKPYWLSWTSGQWFQMLDNQWIDLRERWQEAPNESCRCWLPSGNFTLERVLFLMNHTVIFHSKLWTFSKG